MGPATDGTVVVVGASVAGVRCATSLREAGHTGPVVLLEAETGSPYDKPQLSKHLRDDHELELLAEASALRELGIELRPGVRATGLDLRERVVETSDGTVAFAELVIATGCGPRELPDLPARAGYVRSREDWERLRRVTVAGAELVVVGAGFLGLEAAAAATQLGVRTTVVDLAPRVLTRGVPAAIAALVADRHRDEGVELRLGVDDPVITGDDEQVRVAGAGGIGADFALVAVGAVPRLAWLHGSGLRLEDGVVCDESLRAAPGVWAVGDCARWTNARTGESERHEHWTTAVHHAQHVARSIVSGTPAPMAELAYVWSDQFDWRLQVVGSTAGTERHYTTARGGHVVVSTADGRVVGVATIDAQAVCLRARRLLQAEDPPLERVVAELALDACERVA